MSANRLLRNNIDDNDVCFSFFLTKKNATKLQRVLNKKTSAHEMSATGLYKRDGI